MSRVLPRICEEIESARAAQRTVIGIPNCPKCDTPGVKFRGSWICPSCDELAEFFPNRAARRRRMR
jgi:hypothetical protein